MMYYLAEDYANALPDLENYVTYAGSDATQEMLDLSGRHTRATRYTNSAASTTDTRATATNR